MARPVKKGVDYFQHDTNASDGKTLSILESKYGNDGYAFWFKLLEFLGRQEGLSFSRENNADWVFFVERINVDENIVIEMLDLLATLGAIDKQLWEEAGVIWSDNFVERLSAVYDKRSNPLPQKPILKKVIGEKTGVIGEKTGVIGEKTGVIGEKTQILEKKHRDIDIHSSNIYNNNIYNNILDILPFSSLRSEKGRQNSDFFSDGNFEDEKEGISITSINTKKEEDAKNLPATKNQPATTPKCNSDIQPNGIDPEFAPAFATQATFTPDLTKYSSEENNPLETQIRALGETEGETDGKTEDGETTETGEIQNLNNQSNGIDPEFAPTFAPQTTFTPDLDNSSSKGEKDARNGNKGVLAETGEKEEEKKTTTNVKLDRTPYQEIVDAWNEICTSMPKVVKLTTKRKQSMKLRWQEISEEAKENDQDPMDYLRSIFTTMQGSEFLRGEKDNSTWRANIDWFIRNDSIWVSILEGKYNDRGTWKNKVTDSSEGNKYEYIDPSTF